MDPISAPLVLAGLKQALDSASGAAGVQAWQGFAALARRVFGRSDAEIAPEQAESLAEQVTEAARHDPQLAAALREWLESAARLGAPDESVTNSISDQAKIGGHVVQARDISGPITFN